MNLPIVLDGSKFTWRNHPSESEGFAWTGDHHGFPLSSPAPKQVAVHSPRTGRTQVFDLMDHYLDLEGISVIVYAATLADDRRVTLELGVG